jgi:hypothetical protein
MTHQQGSDENLSYLAFFPPRLHIFLYIHMSSLGFALDHVGIDQTSTRSNL